jgi:hypothetical protein
LSPPGSCGSKLPTTLTPSSSWANGALLGGWLLLPDELNEFDFF